MTHPPTRRDFLKAGALFAAAAAAPGALARRAFAATRGDSGPNTLVSIFLRGGADPLNVFVPYGDDAYARRRQGTAQQGRPGYARPCRLPTLAQEPADPGLGRVQAHALDRRLGRQGLQQC